MQGRVIALEPIPRIFEALSCNAAAHQKQAQELGEGVFDLNTTILPIKARLKHLECNLYALAAHWDVAN